jgi:hypothetical protein
MAGLIESVDKFDHTRELSSFHLLYGGSRITL